jgi:hypothetical protein
MSLELRKNSRSFYSRIRVNGERILHALQTKVEGTPPDGLKIGGKGDTTFEISRAKALDEEKALRETLKKPASKANALKKIHKLQTGEEIKTLKLDQLWLLSRKSIRERSTSEQYEGGCKRRVI